ncbi:putative helicase MOV-10 [Asterias rubens]|uniref:putative helicase MOV-10 n=1 Tax=Asterias rubens TaxID=7604 RepID=UPI001455AEF3|nr:putative helicase MOV-10 [Asterias rubens]
MPKMRKTHAQVLAVGKDFLKFLEDTGKHDVTNKSEMADIYRNEYKPLNSVASRGCSFSRIIYTLRMKNKVKVTGENNQVIIADFAKGRFSAVQLECRDLLSDATKFPSSRIGGQHPYFCADCNVQGTSKDAFTEHLRGKKHLQQMYYRCMKMQRLELIESRKGITVSCEHYDGDGVIGFSMERNCKKEFIITVRNNSVSNEIQFLAWVMLKRQPDITVIQSVQDEFLLPGMQFSLRVSVKTSSLTVLQSPLLLAFKLAKETKAFQILRFLKIEVVSEVAKDLPPTIPYERPKRKTMRELWGEVVEGERLPSSNKSKLVMGELKQYTIPARLRYMGRTDDLEDDKEQNTYEMPLKWDNYVEKLSDLLHIEEKQMEVDIRRYDLEGAIMNQDGKFLRLKVLGLAENRPSVLKGDHLFARYPGDRSNKEHAKKYKGYVHRVELEELVLGFDKVFVNKHIDGQPYDIEFTFNRFPLRRQHFAVEEAFKNHMEPVLFPKSTDQVSKMPLCTVKEDTSEFARQLFDRKLASNEEQMRAIQHIVKGSSRPAPYLVFGPPGTGKTVTIVEAIKQVYNALSECHILACAPSNSATDLIAKRLLTGGTPIDKNNLLRMNATSRDWRTVDETLKDKECCNYDKMTNETYFSSKEDIMKKRVITTTLCTAGRLASADFPKDHFTHVFIDEAGHAVEPEAIIALSNLLNSENTKGGQIVLAGDPKQLGPIIRSPIAIKNGLELSLLERHMCRSEIYKRKEEEPHYDNRVLTKLLRNYRSHPAILKLPNRMFYDNELEVHADELERESLCNWEKLPNKKFPIIFHGVEGIDDREGHSPSFFNKKEIEIVVEYVENLLDKRGGRKIKESDIGVITPYRRQVQKIKEVLKKRHHGDIKVGSVEEFQGQERLVIIVSTVRSTKPEHIQMDIDFHLGFVKNPKRLNVAVTRAKALLILVGNPYMLNKDQNWSMFLQYCIENKSNIGCNFEEEEDELEDSIQKLDQVKITASLVDKLAVDGLGVSAVAEQQDPEWRSEV